MIHPPKDAEFSGNCHTSYCIILYNNITIAITITISDICDSPNLLLPIHLEFWGIEDLDIFGLSFWGYFRKLTVNKNQPFLVTANDLF